jgi:hypothetical protein
VHGLANAGFVPVCRRHPSGLNSWLPPGEASLILPLLQVTGSGKTTVTQMMASM